MRDDRYRFLTISAHLPARLEIEQAAWFLGFNTYDIPVLVAAKLLKPLGRPAVTGHKFFATVELEELRKDAQWLARASDAIVKHWRDKNASRRAARPPITSEAAELTVKT